MFYLQTVSKCGAATGKKKLSERVYKCPQCGYQTARDIASAQVIKKRGLIALQRGLGGFPHERLHF